MATKKNTPVDEKFEKQDLDLFEVLAALDKKDYNYYDRLTVEQQKKFVPHMMIKWMSAVKAPADVQRYYLQSIEYYANKYWYNENIQKNPKLQWLMLCASSPGIGKQFHQYIPEIKLKVSKLQENITLKESKDYFKKIYPTASGNDIDTISKVYSDQHKRKKYLADVYPNLKLSDIDVLNQIVTDEQIKQHEIDSGNQ
jgi:hypothetical protein